MNQRHFGGKHDIAVNWRFKWECRIGENKLSIVASFIILRSGEGLAPFNKNNPANFSSNEKTKMMLSGVSVVLENAKICKPNLESNGLYYVY